MDSRADRIDRETAEVRTLAAVVYGTPEAVDSWMAAPNVRLDGMTPEDAIRAGHTRTLVDLLTALANGTAY